MNNVNEVINSLAAGVGLFYFLNPQVNMANMAVQGSNGDSGGWRNGGFYPIWMMRPRWWMATTST